MSQKELSLSASPHIQSKETTPEIMLWVVISLLPACVWGVYSFGFKALVVLFVSVISCEIFEYIVSKIFFNKNTLDDFSGIVTGLLIGMNLSANVPLFIPILASFFAIVVVKMTFGGLGHNFVNPALAGRLFVFFSFTALMSSFPASKNLTSIDNLVYPEPYMVQSITSASVTSPSVSSSSSASNLSSASSQKKADIKNVSEITSASPLASYKASPYFKKISNLDYMRMSGYPYTKLADKINKVTNINPYIIDAFFGNKSGCIGEISGLLLLLGAILLICKKIITYTIPVFYVGFYALLEWVFGGLSYGNGFFQGEVLYSILTGGILLCAFFMATDMVTSPVTEQGHILYSFLIAVLTFLIRRFSSLPEGVSIALMLANIATPTINKYFKRRVFGVAK